MVAGVDERYPLINDDRSRRTPHGYAGACPWLTVTVGVGLVAFDRTSHLSVCTFVVTMCVRARAYLSSVGVWVRSHPPETTPINPKGPRQTGGPCIRV